MGKREFYAWVDQVHRDTFGPEPSPDSWSLDHNDEDWFEQARAKRDQMMGR